MKQYILTTIIAITLFDISLCMNSKKASSLSEQVALWSNQIQNAKMNSDKWNSVLKTIIGNPEIKNIKMNTKFEYILNLFNKTINFANSLTKDNFDEYFNKLEFDFDDLTQYKKITRDTIDRAPERNFSTKVKNFLSSKKKFEAKNNDITMLNNLMNSIFDILEKKILFLKTSLDNKKFKKNLFYI